MRQIVLDTETTGLDPKLGHRIIEIGGIELVNRRPTQRHFHAFLNPERDIDAGATTVHGLTWEDLKDKPRFADRANQFIEFVRGAELVIHNAPFDIGFLDAELALAGFPAVSTFCVSVLDTLRLAKDLHPGKRNNLNVLCERYQVDHSSRTLHGALLDANLLADVYLAMTRGQASLAISLDSVVDAARAQCGAQPARGRPWSSSARAQKSSPRTPRISVFSSVTTVAWRCGIGSSRSRFATRCRPERLSRRQWRSTTCRKS